MTKRCISTYPSPPVKATFLCESDELGDLVIFKPVSFNPNLGGGCLNELSHEIDLMFFYSVPPNINH